MEAIIRRNHARPAVCTIRGCTNPGGGGARGWCMKHYMRWYRHGDPQALLPRGGDKRSPEARVALGLPPL